jgi:hypothetical protein
MSNVPQRIGNYQLERQIGKGGMSEVWLGRHRSLENRLIAVKLLLSQDAEWIERFTREANITSRLRHDHIIQIFDHGYQPPFHYTIMEYVVGGALRNLIKPHQPLALDQALRIFHDAGLALDYAHTHGVIHRDVSPGNILVEQETGRVLLTDFGIARESGRAGMTTVSKVMGTPGYLSPEHASSAASVTHLSDIYGLGVVLYEMLTGTLPWDHTPGMPDNTGGPFNPPLPLKSRGVQGLPPDVDRVLQTMLAFDPAKRYPSARAAIEDLEQVMSRHTGPTQVIGTPGASKATLVQGFTPAAGGDARIIPAQPVEPHPVEKVLGPDLIKGPMQKARERAEALADQRELVALLNQWSARSPFRRKLLGRQAVFHRATSTNVYFYTLRVLYETREPVKTIEEPDHKAQAVQIEREQDRWGVMLPPPKGFQDEGNSTITLPGSTRVLTCSVCNGPGRVVCPRCQGRARVIVNRGEAKAAPDTAKGGGTATATATATQTAPALVPCPECSGTGSQKCDHCDGVGRLVQKKTTTWRRYPATLSNNDDLPRIDEKWLQRACQTTVVYQEQQPGDFRTEWKLVPELAELIAVAQKKIDADTKIALSEVDISFIPVTEIIFDLGDLPAPATPPAGKPGKGGKSKPARAADSGLYSWHIYGFERQLPKDWRFLNWDRVLMYIFAAILLLVLVEALMLLVLRA